MQLDRSHLELLAAMGTRRTLAEAAEAVHLSASAASRRLQEAERRVGVQLVEMDGRRLTLTATGDLLSDEAVDILDRLVRAEQSARWLFAGQSDAVRVGIGFHDVLAPLLSGAGPAFSLHRVARRDTTNALLDRDVDLLIDVESEAEIARPTPPGLERLPLASDRLVAVTAVGHPLSDREAVDGNDFLDEVYITWDPRPRAGFEWETIFRPVAAASPGRFIWVDSMSMLLDLVSVGAGVSIQPTRAVRLRTGGGVTASPLSCPRLHADVPVRWVAHARTERDDRVTDLCTSLARALQAVS